MNKAQLTKIFSENFKRIMEEDNRLQEDVARDLGVSQSTISQYTTGDRMPSVFMLTELADILDCSLDELLGR